LLTEIHRPDGSVRYRVRAVIDGKDRRKQFLTLEAAQLEAAEWLNERKVDMRVLATRLAPSDLADAEAALPVFRRLGLGFSEAAQWMAEHYRRPATISWEAAVTEYEEARRKAGISGSQISNVTKAARRFGASVRRPAVGVPTRAEVESFLSTLAEDASPSTYNGLLGDVATFLEWLKVRGYTADNPAAGMERRKVVRGLPEILKPAQVEALLRDLEKQDPLWIPYAAICAFAAVRPGTREGEAFRLDRDLRADREVFHPGGIEIHGKANGVRIVPWPLCGPLQAWLEAYPGNGGLWPSVSPTAAERAWAKVRARHGLSADVLRHTAISAMCYAPGGSLAQVALAAGNSEAMIRRHYLGRWSTEMTQELWGLLPSK
jgi:integrase